jgi:hypothetical protein
MSADCIPHSSLAEFSVSADDYGLMFYGPVVIKEKSH